VTPGLRLLKPSGKVKKGDMAIGEAITAGKALVEVSKLVVNLINSPDYDAQHVRQKVQEMFIHLVSLQTSLSEAQQEILELRSKLDDRQVRKVLDADMDFRIDGGFYIRKSESAKGVIAYCPICWKKDDKAVPLQASSLDGCFNCSIHETEYKTAEGRKNSEAFWRAAV